VVTGSAMADPEYANEAIQQFKQGSGPLTNPNVDMFGKVPCCNNPFPYFTISEC
jgi:hypothetical protein